MEFVCGFLLLVLGTSAATPQDLTGKMFTFPEDSDGNFVQVDLQQSELSAFTVCMRVFTDMLRVHSLVQISSNSSYIAKRSLSIINNPQNSQYGVDYDGSSTHFNMKNYRVNEWQSLCSSWAADTGIARVWVQGEPSCRKSLSQTHITGPLSVIIGQRKSRFSSSLVFTGMVSDLHVWDRELTPIEIQNIGPMTNFAPGTVLSWNQLDFQIHGQVLLETKHVR